MASSPPAGKPAAAPDAPNAPPRYGLYLAEVRIEDFRALADVCVRLGRDCTVLVGENNTGKTSFLDAISVALGDRQPRVEDIHRAPGKAADGFVIDLRLEPTEGGDFDATATDTLGLAVQLEEPPFFTLRVRVALGEDRSSVVLRRVFVKGWARSRADAARLVELKSPSVGREVMALLHFEMLDARRDIVEQLRQRRSHWGRIASSHEVPADQRAALETALKALGEQVTASSPVLSQTRQGLRELSEALGVAQLSVDIEALPRDLDDLLRAMDLVIDSPGSTAFPVGVHGMGTRSLAALFVFRAYVNVVQARRRIRSSMSVSAFEEPEAHLHPQAQRAVFSILQTTGGQKVLSTHSAQVASVANIADYRLFRRAGPHAVVTFVDDTRIAAWGATTQFQRYVLEGRPEVFFARAVAIVEGTTESAAMPVFARARWGPRGADAVGVTMVSTDGAGSSKHVVPILDALGIPWVIFCDGDGAADDGLKGCSTALGRSVNRTSPEVIQLPAGADFEAYLVDAGFAKAAERAADRHPAGTLADYRARMDRQKRKHKALRDYTTVGWEERLILDFLRGEKGTIGAILAEEICKEQNPDGSARLPPLLTDFFDRLEQTSQGR